MGNRKSCMVELNTFDLKERRKYNLDSARKAITGDHSECVTGNLQASPDFSALDYLVWIRILSYLDQEDRLAVANTCTRLQQFCLQEHCLWRTLKLHVGWDIPQRKRRKKIKLNEMEKEIVRVSTGKAQDVDFNLYCLEKRNFDKESLQCLNDASKTWPLKSFSFCANVIGECDACYDHDLISCPNSELPPSSKQILINCLTSTNASGLKCLKVHSHIWTDKIGCSAVFRILKDSPFSHSLETLLLDWNIYFRIMPFLTTDYMSGLCSTVGRFINLQRLNIPSVYLTDQVLEALSQPGRASLKYFSLQGGIFPEKLSSWPQLLAASPRLKVMIYFTENFISDSISLALPSYVPVVFWYLRKLSSTSISLLERRRELWQLLLMYAPHVTSLIFEHDELLTDCDKELYLLASMCTNLTVLRFKGQISSAMILELAAMKRKWIELSFVDVQITFPQKRPWEGNQEQNMARLCSEVSRSLGYQWRPSPETRLVNELSCTTDASGVVVEAMPKHVHL